MCRASISVESYDYFTGPDNYSCSGVQEQGGVDPIGWIHFLLVYTYDRGGFFMFFLLTLYADSRSYICWLNLAFQWWMYTELSILDFNPGTRALPSAEETHRLLPSKQETTI